MVDADRYQRAVRLVGMLARRLADTCANLDELAGAEVAALAWLVKTAAAEGLSLAGLDSNLVVEAAMSQRFRVLLAEQATDLQRQVIERARAAGQAWAVIEEPPPAAWSAGAARWVEAHVATGALLVRSVVADPQTGRPAYRLEVLGGGGTGPGDGVRVDEYADRDAWLGAIDDVRNSFESQS
jgi:hypothetical protein